MVRDEIALEWLGRVGYEAALARQRARREARIAGAVPDVLFLLEHDPVVTTGRRGAESLERVRWPIVRTERGGLATYHGPGQLVGYPIVDIGARGGSVRATVAAIEEGLVRWLSWQGVEATSVAGRPGVWVGRDKIAAIGLHFRRGVAMHGFALNLTVDLRGFEGFVPCGLPDAGVTSLERLTGRAVPPEAAWEEVGRCVARGLAGGARQGAIRSLPPRIDREGT